MSKLSLQFHALPDEACNLLRGLLDDRSLFVTEAFGAPLRFRLWNGEDSTCDDEKRTAFAFTPAPPVLDIGSLHEFRRRNPDALIVEIGQVTLAGLTESWLSARSENTVVMQRWKKAARQLQAATLIGAIAVNPRNGATAPMRGHRFTSGARQAFAQGQAMLPAAGNSIVQLPLAQSYG